MTDDKNIPLRERMVEDMRIRGMGDNAQKSHIRAIKDFATFLKRSPDTATPEELRAYQLHMTDSGVTASTFNTRIIALRFFFGMTCGREKQGGDAELLMEIDMALENGFRYARALLLNSIS
jgi:integrase/recombinase XerD